VTPANLTNVQGSVVIVVVFLSLAATVIVVRLRTRRRQNHRPARPANLLERIEAMTNEEHEAWRAAGRERYEADRRERQERRQQQGPDSQRHRRS
jgi:hypothetical protein